MILPRWQYITQGKNPEDHILYAESAMKAGCKWVQLRMKQTPEEVIFDTALKLRESSKNYGSLLFINDKVEIAKEVKADGVHLGKNDLAPNAARMLLDETMMIGGTANTIGDIHYLKMQGVDYIGLGPFRFTSTKKKLSPILGLTGYKDIISSMERKGIGIPVFAIGGIESDDINPLMDTGIYGIAVSGLVTKASDKHEIVEKINHSLVKNINV